MKRTHGLQRLRGDKNAIAKRLRIARSMQNPPLTQEGLALAIEQIPGVEMHTSQIGKIEANHRSVYDFEVIALSQALGVSGDWLLGLTDEHGPTLPSNPLNEIKNTAKKPQV